VKQDRLGLPNSDVVVHMASSQRSRGSEVKGGHFDGVRRGVVEVGANYHLLDVIFLLAHMGILIFCFYYK
jgi:hypothetical protein